MSSRSKGKTYEETKNQKKTKQNKNKTIKKQTTTMFPPTSPRKKKGSAEAWTRTAWPPGSLPHHWATEEDIVDCVQNIIFEAYFCGIFLVNLI